MRKQIDIKELQKDQLRGQQGASDVTYSLYNQPIYDPKIHNLKYYDHRNQLTQHSAYYRPNPQIPNNPRIPQPHPNTVPGPINTHSVSRDPLKSRVDHNDFNEGLGLTDEEKYQLRDNIGVEDRYIYPDSRIKLGGSNPAQGYYSWDIVAMNNNTPLKNIIEAEIEEFIIPNVAVDPTYQPAYFYFKTVFVYIESIYAQQYGTGGTTKSLFHFEMEVHDEPDGRKRLKPKNRKYIFTMPVRDITILNVRFRTPTQDIRFNQDVYTAAAVQPADHVPDGDKRFVLDDMHNLTIGATYAVYFENFNSVDNDLNTVINNPTGHLALVIDATKIQLTNTPLASRIAITPKQGGGVPYAKILIGERRIAMQLRMRGLRGTLTNYMNP